jgi:hypothetical protein
MGRLDCRFSTGVFVVKPRLKASDYLTRNYLDSNTPLFYSLKQRKKSGFPNPITKHRQHQHITHLAYSTSHKTRQCIHVSHCNVHLMHIKRTLNAHLIYINVHSIHIKCTLNVHIKCTLNAYRQWAYILTFAWRGRGGGRREEEGRRTDVEDTWEIVEVRGEREEVERKARRRKTERRTGR